MIRSFLCQLGAGALLTLRAFRGLARREWLPGEVARQAFQAGNRSFLLVLVTLGFVGMILIFHGGMQSRRIIGDLSLMGPAYIQLILREFGPIMTALMVAARVGAGIAAEVGTMVVTDQVDALRMNAADPVRYIVSPRLAAVAGTHLALAVFGSAVAILSGAFAANVFFEVGYGTFLDLRFIEWGDFLTGLVKAAAFGLHIPIVAAWAGLRVRGGSEGVGEATTAAVVLGSLGVILLDVILGGFFYAVGL